ncbi:MAG TPA: hypothetical protein VGF67_27005 [Ktedonobacteraceae bacterium]
MAQKAELLPAGTAFANEIAKKGVTSLTTLPRCLLTSYPGSGRVRVC